MSTSSDPGGVVGEAGEGQVAQPGVLGIADESSTEGMAPVAGLQVGDVGIGQVGDEDLVAPSLGVEQG